MRNSNNVTIEPSRFHELLLNMMNKAADQAAEAPNKFATIKENYTAFQTIYCLLRCTQDFWYADCRECLSNAIANMPTAIFNQTAIEGFGGNLSCNRILEAEENSIYHIVFSHTVMFIVAQKQRQMMDLCNGKFQLEIFGNMTVNMTWAREPQNAADHCSNFVGGSYYVGPPNGDEKIDSLVGCMLAKIAEEVTDRDGSGRSGNDGTGLTVSSSCISPFQKMESGPPLYTDEDRKISFNAVGLNGYRYMIPYIWNQKIRNCALKSSEMCSSNAILVEHPRGHLKGGIVVNHTDGLQPYAPNQKFAQGSDDHLLICQSHSILEKCSVIIQVNNGEFNRKFKVLGSRASIEFTSGDHVPFESRGWELSYSADMQEAPAVYVWNRNNVRDIYGIYGQFNITLAALMNRLVNQAVSSSNFFAVGDSNLPDFTNNSIYGLVQCTPDIMPSDCNICLSNCVSQIPQCCIENNGGRVYSPSCNIRFEPYLFYKCDTTSILNKFQCRDCAGTVYRLITLAIHRRNKRSLASPAPKSSLMFVSVAGDDLNFI
ncbi:hypothetical protein LWI28_020824 [Acer negundo]|uniref:Gnk2-homologous domain-containing protein n=1 Tax=Acer negundo TaxID=4023 RepID=A0AAD5JQ09_ACENE|nr:hypothetical protein LWI28_020824 [Acer negundo]